MTNSTNTDFSRDQQYKIRVFIIHLRLNNVQQSMEKPGTQAQLIKTRILYCWSREKSVLVLLVTREIRIMYSKSRALQQLCDSFVSETTWTSWY